MWQSVIEVTDATRAVKDTYIFDITWWPFERTATALLIRTSPRDEEGPAKFAQAYRHYDFNVARTDPPRKQ